MPELSQFSLYLAAALLLAITPGPGIFYVAARTLAGGRAEGIASGFGNGLGGMAHVLAGSLGASAIVLASAELFTALKFVGAGYLVWMGLRTFLLARADALAEINGLPVPPPIGLQRSFREGILVELLNPKTAAFFLAFIPQFVDTTGNVALQFMMLGFVSVLLNTSADIIVAFTASRIRQGAATRPNLVRRLRAGSGIGMIALGVGLALARRPTH